MITLNKISKPKFVGRFKKLFNDYIYLGQHKDIILSRYISPSLRSNVILVCIVKIECRIHLSSFLKMMQLILNISRSFLELFKFEIWNSFNNELANILNVLHYVFCEFKYNLIRRPFCGIQTHSWIGWKKWMIQKYNVIKDMNKIPLPRNKTLQEVQFN